MQNTPGQCPTTSHVCNLTPHSVVHCCTQASLLGARSAPVLISGSPCLLDSLLSIRLYKLFLICLHISMFVEKIFIRITRGEFAPEFSSSFLYDVICQITRHTTILKSSCDCHFESVNSEEALATAWTKAVSSATEEKPFTQYCV